MFSFGSGPGFNLGWGVHNNYKYTEEESKEIQELRKEPNFWWQLFTSHAKSHGLSESLKGLPESDRLALKKFLQQIGICDQDGRDAKKEVIEVFFIRSGDYYYLSQSKDAIETKEFELKVQVYEDLVKPHFTAFLVGFAIFNPKFQEEAVSVKDTSYSQDATPFETEVISLSFERKTK